MRRARVVGAAFAVTLVASCGGRPAGIHTGHALAGSANSDAGIYISPVDKVQVGSFVLIRDPDLQNTTASPITIVALHVAFATPGIADVGHVAYVETGSYGLLDTWRSTDGGPDAPWLQGREVKLIGAVIAPHALFLTNGCSYAKLAVTQRGTFVSNVLDIVYRQGNRLHRESLAGGYHLWTLGSPRVLGD